MRASQTAMMTPGIYPRRAVIIRDEREDPLVPRPSRRTRPLEEVGREGVRENAAVEE
jgi:hypothetical protein